MRPTKVKKMIEITTNQIKSIAMIGFDALKGPVLEWNISIAKDFEMELENFFPQF